MSETKLGGLMDKLAEPVKPREYPQHILDGFSQGALLDLRVRFAMQLLTHSPMFASNDLVAFSAEGAAQKALQVADAVLRLADEQGWIKDFDNESPLPESLGLQAARMGAFEAFKQIGAQSALASARGVVAPAGPGVRVN